VRGVRVSRFLHGTSSGETRVYARVTVSRKERESDGTSQLNMKQPKTRLGLVRGTRARMCARNTHTHGS